jgi:uncharacterized protein YgiM (DUF1202 family)
MIKRIFIVLVICFMGVAALAEDWQSKDVGPQYDCDVYSQIIFNSKAGRSTEMSTMLDLTLVKTTHDAFTISEYLGTITPDTLLSSQRQQALLRMISVVCDPDASVGRPVTLYNVKLNSDANIRSCASASCEIVRPAHTGEMLDIIGAEDGWLQIRDENGPAYIAEFLVYRVMCLG